MITEIRFMSQADAVKLVPMQDTALISITEPGELADLAQGWDHLHRISFHDCDESTFSGCILFDSSMADRLIDFVDCLPHDVNRIFIHCNAGISRSAAVAKFISERLDVNFNNQYPLYNKLVYRTLRTNGFEKNFLIGMTEPESSTENTSLKPSNR